MKEIYMQIMQENAGLPEEMTINDIMQMKKLEIYNWEKYDLEQKKLKNMLIIDEFKIKQT